MTNNDEITQENKSEELHAWDVCDQVMEEMDMIDVSWDGYSTDPMGKPQLSKDVRDTMFTVREGDKTIRKEGWSLVHDIKERYPDASMEQIIKYLESIKKCAIVAETGNGSLTEAKVDRILAEMELSGVEITEEKRAEIYQAVKKHDKYDDRNEELHQDEIDRDEKRNDLYGLCPP